jgi:hypothetical protein
MADLAGYNAADYEPADEFKPIPEGTYRAIITASDYEENKKKTGSFLKLTIQILDNPYNGRTVFDRLNLDNPNEVAVDIAKRQLSAVCRAVGKMTPKDSAELHNIPFTVKLGVTPDGKYSEILSYKPIKSETAAPAANGGAAAPPAAVATGAPTNGSGKKAPWAR